MAALHAEDNQHAAQATYIQAASSGRPREAERIKCETIGGPPPSPGGLVDQTEEELRNLREALFTVKTALVEMRTRSSLVSDDSEDALAPL